MSNVTFLGGGSFGTALGILLAKKENKVSIYDRDKNALTKSERTGTLTQSREYVYGDLYVHALGYASQKYDLSGLEKTFDTELTTYSSVQVGLRNFFKDLSFESLKEKTISNATGAYIMIKIKLT